MCVCGSKCTSAGISLREYSLTNPACNAPPYCHLLPLWLHHIFWHYLINRTIFGQTLQEIKCVFWFSRQLLFETFLVVRRIQRDIVINVKTCSCKVPVMLVELHENWISLTDLRKQAQILNFVTMLPVVAELFHADRQMDGRMYMTKLILQLLFVILWTCLKMNRPWRV